MSVCVCVCVCLLIEPTTSSPFPGKRRLWVITVPSHNNHYLRMMENQLEEMDQVQGAFMLAIANR